MKGMRRFAGIGSLCREGRQHRVARRGRPRRVERMGRPHRVARTMALILMFLPMWLFGQWGNLAGNQHVSATNAQGSGMTPLHQLPTSDRLLTKEALNYYFNLNQTELAGYADNQLVPKEDIVEVALTYYTYYVSYSTYSTYAEVCSDWNPIDEGQWIVVYSGDSPLTTGSTVFTDTGLTTEYALDWSLWRGVCPANDVNDRSAVRTCAECYGYVSEMESCTGTYYFSAEPWSIWADPLGETVTVTVTADGNTYDLTCEDTWFTTNVSQVTGNSSFTVTIDPNSSGVTRLNQITVTSGGNYVVGIQLRQDEQ